VRPETVGTPGAIRSVVHRRRALTAAPFARHAVTWTTCEPVAGCSVTLPFLHDSSRSSNVQRTRTGLKFAVHCSDTVARFEYAPGSGPIATCGRAAADALPTPRTACAAITPRRSLAGKRTVPSCATGGAAGSPGGGISAR
jgi:hypothetical protein